MARGRRRVTSAQLRARGNPRWVERAREEQAKAKGEVQEGELWTGVSGQLRSVIGDCESLLELLRRAHVAYGHLRLFCGGLPNGLSIDEFDKLCEHFGLCLSVEADLEADQAGGETAEEVSSALDTSDVSDIIESDETESIHDAIVE